MKMLLLAITFILSSTIEITIATANTAQRATIKNAVSAWKRLMTCQRLAATTTQEAAYRRCLNQAMPPSADRFDQMKVTEFLLLELPVKSLGRCPASLEPIQKLRKSTDGLKIVYACFIVTTNAEGTEGPMGGEVEYAQTKNGELKVRRIRYSY